MSRFFGFFSDRPTGDLVLSDVAHSRPVQLPARGHPLKLGEQYPRDRQLTRLVFAKFADHLFAELMLDRPGRRGGFRPPMAAELLVLREWFD